MSRVGNVIIGWKANTGTEFAKILRHFIPPPATIIDLCAGERRMYRKMNGNRTLDDTDYNFIFGDIRELKDLDYICDITEPPEELFNTADGYVYDPPWPSKSGGLNDMIQKYCPMEKEDFPKFLDESLEQISKIIKPGGVLICKSAHPWNHEIYIRLNGNGYGWLRDIPQIGIYKGVYLTSYFSIYKKDKLQLDITEPQSESATA